MKELRLDHGNPLVNSRSYRPQAGEPATANLLHLLRPQEINELRLALNRAGMPADFEAKLGSLSGGRLGHHYIEQNCRLFLALLKANREGLFAGANADQCERLLRVLTYVHKDDDAIPDFRTDGFDDDLLEVRAAGQELAPLLAEFKCWRLEHQVPQLWLNRHREQAVLSS